MKMPDMSIKGFSNREVTEKTLKYHNLVMGVWLNEQYVTYYNVAGLKGLVYGVSSDRYGKNDFKYFLTMKETANYLNTFLKGEQKNDYERAKIEKRV